jgi:hypothetical protein
VFPPLEGRTTTDWVQQGANETQSSSALGNAVFQKSQQSDLHNDTPQTRLAVSYPVHGYPSKPVQIHFGGRFRAFHIFDFTEIYGINYGESGYHLGICFVVWFRIIQTEEKGSPGVF